MRADVVHAAVNRKERADRGTQTQRVDFRDAFAHYGGEYNVRHPFTAMELFLLLLEAGVALALLLGIVWWTWPRPRKKDDERQSLSSCACRLPP